jgi:quinol monooxygenase YgiN
MSIIVSGSLHVAPKQRDAFLEARVPILEHAREAPGCLDFSLSADSARRQHRGDRGRCRVASHQRERGTMRSPTDDAG